MLLSYRTRYDTVAMERSSLSIWLNLAGMAQSDPSVGSIASFINYLSQIIFTIMVGF